MAVAQNIQILKRTYVFQWRKIKTYEMNLNDMGREQQDESIYKTVRKNNY